MRVHCRPCRSTGRATMFAAMRCTVAILLVLSFAAAPAQAQFWMPFGSQPAPSRPKPQPQTPALPKLPATAGPTTPPPQDQPAPYDRDLQRLSEILGALHFLRGICGSNEGQKWRNEAQTLIETAAPAGERRG